MATDDELLDRLRLALTDDALPEPRATEVARIRALAAARSTGRTSSRRTLQIVAIAASLGAGFTIGAQVQFQPTEGGSTGVVEFDQSIAASNRVSVTVEGRLTGIGRIVNLSSTDLPILVKGEFYEVWFVGPGDTPVSRNRISAGTFHPDQNGKTNVTLTAAVDPRLYPILVITAEPGDGNPNPSAREVLRGQLKIVG